MKRNLRSRIALAAVPLAALLGACGNNLGSSDPVTTDPVELGQDATGRAFAGAEKCIDCHQDFSWSDDLVAGYLEGKHVVHSSHIEATSDPECLACHDPVGDGVGLEAIVDEAAVPEGGLAAVTCEACHGAGGEHYGVGPMPVAKPDADTCGQCHGTLPGSHLTYHPEADDIVTRYSASPHTHSVNSHVFVDGSDTDARARCSKCHTDEGAKLYKNVDAEQGHDDLVDSFPGSAATVANPTAVQCRTCHDPHKAGQLLLGETLSWDGSSVTASAEYRTCTNCHQLFDTSVGYAYHDPEENPYGAFGEILADTHLDDPATLDVIEGYVVKRADDHACSECHDVHAADNTINEQWAKSGHAGELGTVKAAAEDGGGDTAAVFAAGVTDATGAAWSHYPWTDESRSGCVQCHTATGAVAYNQHLAAGRVPADFDPTAIPAPTDEDQDATVSLYDAGGKFPHIAKTVDDTDPDDIIITGLQKEVLSCNGCHTGVSSGKLRNPGAVTAGYTVDGADAVLADLGSSNLCINCHSGRGNMDKLVATSDPAADAAATTATKTHYMNAAATLFNTTLRPGYEYAGQSYANGFFTHPGIGLNGDDAETGSGPCAGCHMGSDEGHTFAIFNEAGDEILPAAVCAGCHGSLNASRLSAEADGYHKALEALELALEGAGSFFYTAYPYFHDAGGLADGDLGYSGGHTFTAWVDEGHLGAAHNYNYLHHEPGAYAHNSAYAKRLIYDSLDWLNNGALDGDVVVADPDAAAWLGGDRP